MQAAAISQAYATARLSAGLEALTRPRPGLHQAGPRGGTNANADRLLL